MQQESEIPAEIALAKIPTKGYYLFTYSYSVICVRIKNIQY